MSALFSAAPNASPSSRRSACSSKPTVGRRRPCVKGRCASSLPPLQRSYLSGLWARARERGYAVPRVVHATYLVARCLTSASTSRLLALGGVAGIIFGILALVLPNI